MISATQPELLAILETMECTIRELRTELSEIHRELKAKDSVPSIPRKFYSTEDVAKEMCKSEYTVREWCRLGRINATKREERRGVAALWRVSTDEMARIKNEGLLPIDMSRNSTD